MVTAVGEIPPTSQQREALRAFVLSATTAEVVDRLARSEGRLRELDEQLQLMRESLVDHEA
ncbi:MAG: hypothetical protein R2770_07795 [Acidimicrobiales bacterium]|nr:hypothetical protein [Acidimicrobiales bacterium]